ncbi:synaptojanin-2-binding protein isoform X1 [Balaenoptera acutorostrata]|uniref:Synaptojanin-2-binding protein isoform X1 n=1 Tax=Balaenoptera acutorostrata TaxID=9767 RepID=A0ABM3T8N1_BALAC|nr:synaptojanin-2-binding protein isoform X1 [Balaenoptera acutorostrata]XP_057398402.1 synaptojanin-2-binding protein isoform X1 [Balaenoptera acutorostrata]
MNGRVDYLLTEEEINLTRGPSGLGFNIVGGTDQQYVSNDSGIFVSSIKENGAAALDGRLQEGDKILSITAFSPEHWELGSMVKRDLKNTGVKKRAILLKRLWLKVNGQDLKNLLHQDAVDLFRNAGYAVSLRVQHRLQVQNGPIGHHGEGEPSGIPITVVVVPVFALIVVAAWAFMRYRQRL